MKGYLQAGAHDFVKPCRLRALGLGEEVGEFVRLCGGCLAPLSSCGVAVARM